MEDVLDLYPLVDVDTADLLDHAVDALACLRGLDHRRNDPAVRLHLLTSLYEQTRSALFEATITARDHGYSPTQIAVVLNLH
jgi:hypothetical protein